MSQDAPPPTDLTLDDPLAQRLLAARPVPTPTWRGGLRRRLVALGPPAARPRRLWLTATAYAGAGVVLLAVAALGVLAEIGPLAP